MLGLNEAGAPSIAAEDNIFWLNKRTRRRFPASSKRRGSPSSKESTSARTRSSSQRPGMNGQSGTRTPAFSFHHNHCFQGQRKWSIDWFVARCNIERNSGKRQAALEPVPGNQRYVMALKRTSGTNPSIVPGKIRRRRPVRGDSNAAALLLPVGQRLPRAECQKFQQRSLPGRLDDLYLIPEKTRSKMIAIPSPS